jgi:hypothetical protein
MKKKTPNFNNTTIKVGGKFKVGKRIGGGAFGEVFQGIAFFLS